MSVEENKAIVRRWLEAWNTGELEVLRELIAPNYVHHSSVRTVQPESGPVWYTEFVSEVRTHFPDFHVTAEDLLADGDKVIGRWAWGGTHLVASTTPWGTIVPPTGRKVANTTITITRIADGKIAEEWWESDSLANLQQLGAVPSPSQATT